VLGLLPACAERARAPEEREAAPRGDGAIAAADAPPLIERCLPACILSLYDGCRPGGACVAEAHGTATAICYASGVTVVRRGDGDGTVVWTSYAAGGAVCLEERITANEYVFARASDGRIARMHIVSRDLRTAFCGPDERDTYDDVYRLPDCLALERIDCAPGACPIP
jgi:hypothetical protein